jgi:tetratricopeptide (TPR) repeat protein
LSFDKSFRENLGPLGPLRGHVERQIRRDDAVGVRRAEARFVGGTLTRICRVAAGALFAISIALSLAAAAYAQSAPPPESAPPDRAVLEAQYNQLFQQMLKEPNNLDVLFRFAELASTLDNYEPAITALERTLLVNPDLPQIKFELGVMYFLLKSDDIARGYLSEAHDAANAPKAIRDRAAEFLAEIEKRAPAQ